MSARRNRKKLKISNWNTFRYKGNHKIRYYETLNGSKKAKLKEYHLKIQVKDASFIKKADMTFEDLSKKYTKIKSVYYHPKHISIMNIDWLL